MSEEMAYPHNEMNEQSALDMLMTNPMARDRLLARLESADFYVPKNQLLFDEIRDTVDGLEGTPPRDLTVAVADHMLRDGTLDKIGGVEYMQTVAVAPPVDADWVVGKLKGDTMRREIIRLGKQAQQLGQTVEGDPDDVLRQLTDAMLDITPVGGDARDVRDAYDLTDGLLKRLRELSQTGVLPGVVSGLDALDGIAGSLQPGQMVVIAGRPGMGKSTLGMDYARHAALVQRIPTVVFNLEMGGEELMLRLLAAQSGIPMHTLQHPSAMGADLWRLAGQCRDALKDAPLWVSDDAGITMGGVRAECRRLDRVVRSRGGDGLGLVVIDYLQLMSSGRRVESRQVEVSGFSRQCKLLAKEMGLPVIVLSQLNRGSEMRSDREPMMSDLRESGAIEQDADIVMLVHRPDRYDPSDRAGEADVNVAKHRNGVTGKASLAFLGDQSRFADMPEFAPVG